MQREPGPVGAKFRSGFTMVLLRFGGISLLAFALLLPEARGGGKAARDAGLVDLKKLDPTLVIDARYATTENFVGLRLYPRNRLFLARDVAARLVRIQQRLAADRLGLKVLDAYRPLSVQWILWNRVPDERYVANPEKGSMHNRACAVDVTLVDASGRELPMPTAYDDFSERAHRDYAGLPPEISANRARLEKAMVDEGFFPLPTEWWHFEIPQCADRPVLDIDPY